MINNNSLSTGTNIEFGSNDLGGFWLNAQTCSLPGISFALPEADGRSGARIKLGSDTVEYGDLVVTVLLDREWKMYDIIYDKFMKSLRVDKGTFSHYQDFDMWLDIKTGKGAEVRKFWFYKCRLAYVSEFDFDSRDSADTNLDLTLTFRFDWYEYKGTTIPQEV